MQVSAKSSIQARPGAGGVLLIVRGARVGMPQFGMG